ncbi:carbohydrate kinase family protein [Nonomuraea gerenzanensis]|uniref:Fructokinase n=1 Tax=Nonomuraea gerenzanensis TaxID=93944 RepID=A0A1M4E940_9ACTN|nr:carbohydrate kinase [Nonomuraea gerenzanensis]UBU17482.1 carbohydrate kinase [Nonomuraea gerenzanensis]SBO95238.1 Fructokinase [Nonomuraea gerenzanensis]
MIAVLGECVADAFAGRPAAGSSGGPAELVLRALPGGGPANTAVALARLGTRARFLGRLSHDVFGALFRERLSASGVDLTACVEAGEPSTLAVAALDEHGRAEYTFYATGTADWQWSAGELGLERLGAASCLHTGSLALVKGPGGEAVEEFARAASARATISIDPNVRPSLAARGDYQVERWCAFADILKLSDDDLGFLLPGVPPEQACDRWHAAGARLVVVTRGAAGALVSLDGERATVAAPSVEVVDTVGAGDAFTAGLLHSLEAGGLLGGRLDTLDLETVRAAAEYAARVSALTCSVAGADPPWAHRL